MQLGLAADQRRVESACVRAGTLDHREHVPSRVRIALPLQLQLLARLQHDGVLDEPACRIADEDLTCARGLLEALRDVDGIAGDEHLPAGPVARDDLTRVDADADADADRKLALELFVQLGQRQAQLRRRTHRTQRIVLV